MFISELISIVDCCDIINCLTYYIKCYLLLTISPIGSMDGQLVLVNLLNLLRTFDGKEYIKSDLTPPTLTKCSYLDTLLHPSQTSLPSQPLSWQPNASRLSNRNTTWSHCTSDDYSVNSYSTKLPREWNLNTHISRRFQTLLFLFVFFLLVLSLLTMPLTVDQWLVKN